jgi:hypothetical protein
MIRFSFLCLLLLLSLFSVRCKKDYSEHSWNLLHFENYSALILYPADMVQKRGVVDGDSWTIDENYEPGIFQISPGIENLGNGSAKVMVSLKIPDNRRFSDKVATINIFNKNDGSLLSSRTLFKNDFSHNNIYQDFELYFEAEQDASLEFRLIWHGTSELSFSQARIEIYKNKAGTPVLVNKSGISDAYAGTLVQRALEGLGFNAAAPDGPNKNDLVFVGQYYIAWIDQTGFYGKMNGLWLLNGFPGDSLNFLHMDNGRPVNYLGVAEKGDGMWMQNYTGAEHYELPQLIDEPGEIPFNGMDFANWYSVNEAGRILGAHLPHWKSAMNYRMGFSILNEPFERTETARQLYVNYESPVTKESDGDLIKDGDHAHANMIFADFIRYPFFLRTGYTLYGDKPYFERHYQYRNGDNNPAFTSLEIGDWSLIGGIVVTAVNSPYGYKTGLNKFVRVNEFSVGSFQVDTWADVDPRQSGPPDVLWHYGQSYTMSNNASFEPGNSIHVTTTSNGSRATDMGGCTCYVHGGLEIGGGVLIGSDVVPLGPGALSKIDTRKFLFPQNSSDLVESTINIP